MNNEHVNSNTEWFYEKNGERIGAVSQSAMIEMIKSNVLSKETPVWKKGLAGWEALEKTELAQYFDTSAPPPLTGQHVNNTIVWILAFAPIIGAFLEYFFALMMADGNEIVAAHNVAEGYYFLITIALNIILSFMDEMKLEKAGISTEKFKGMVWLVPVYLFQRAKALKHNLAYFIVWIVCFLLMLLN